MNNGQALSLFLVACRWMRSAQQDSLKTGDRFDLEAAKTAEKEVDRLLNEYRDGWGPLLPQLIRSARNCRRCQRYRHQDRNRESLDQAKVYELDLDRTLAEIDAEIDRRNAEEAKARQGVSL